MELSKTIDEYLLRVIFNFSDQKFLKKSTLCTYLKIK